MVIEVGNINLINIRNQIYISSSVNEICSLDNK